MELIRKYFPDLTPRQQEQFALLDPLYRDWNAKINVVSRKDIDALYEKHVLHSLGIAKVIQFKPFTEILDVGTGGGFPGIPLAVLFPQCRFHLVDSIGKKIKVVQEVAQGLGLTNVTAEQIRAEQLQETYDFVVSRAVTDMTEFYGWVRNKINKPYQHDLRNGILYLKGGDLTEELKDAKVPYKLFPLSDYFEEEFFETKQVVYVPVK
ncbi:MAG: 16S rRNA (guanine(527)-N(7))-methyltransferase RsmG [Cytophagales bacterium]|nr:16S rRNA (guanine(527)-N(7))-methyltransferase RsmG [Cytophagales bacterium]